MLHSEKQLIKDLQLLKKDEEQSSKTFYKSIEKERVQFKTKGIDSDNKIKVTFYFKILII